MLGNPAVQVGLRHADQVGSQVQQQRQDDQPDQGGKPRAEPAAQVLAGEHVDDVTGEDGREQAADRGHHNACQYQQQLFPVGLQVGENPDNQLLGNLRAVLFFFFCEVTAPPGAAGTCHMDPLPFCSIICDTQEQGKNMYCSA